MERIALGSMRERLRHADLHSWYERDNNYSAANCMMHVSNGLT